MSLDAGQGQRESPTLKNLVEKDRRLAGGKVGLTRGIGGMLSCQHQLGVFKGHAMRSAQILLAYRPDRLSAWAGVEY